MMPTAEMEAELAAKKRNAVGRRWEDGMEAETLRAAAAAAAVPRLSLNYVPARAARAQAELTAVLSELTAEVDAAVARHAAGLVNGWASRWADGTDRSAAGAHAAVADFTRAYRAAAWGAPDAAAQRAGYCMCRRLAAAIQVALAAAAIASITAVLAGDADGGRAWGAIPWKVNYVRGHIGAADAIAADLAAYLAS